MWANTHHHTNNIRMTVQNNGESCANPAMMPAQEIPESKETKDILGLPRLPQKYKVTDLIRKRLCRGKQYGEVEGWEVFVVKGSTRYSTRAFGFGPKLYTQTDLLW